MHVTSDLFMCFGIGITMKKKRHIHMESSFAFVLS